MAQVHLSCGSGLRIEQYQKAGLRSATSARFRHFIALVNFFIRVECGDFSGDPEA